MLPLLRELNKKVAMYLVPGVYDLVTKHETTNRWAARNITIFQFEGNGNKRQKQGGVNASIKHISVTMRVKKRRRRSKDKEGGRGGDRGSYNTTSETQRGVEYSCEERLAQQTARRLPSDPKTNEVCTLVDSVLLIGLPASW